MSPGSMPSSLMMPVHEWEGQQARDTHNSSNPPFSEGPGRKTKMRSLRRTSGRKPGQLGHRSQTLRLVATPDA